MLPLPTIASRILTTPGFTFPKTLEKLTQLIADAATDSEIVRALVSSDPLLTATVLSQANQSGEGGTRLSEALRSVGLGGVIGLTRSFSAIPDHARVAVGGCWQLGFACGKLTRIIARLVGSRHPTSPLAGFDDETLHAAGLLHDLGSALAAVRFPAEYARAVARQEAGDGPFSRLLHSELGADAGDLGYLFGRGWNLHPLLLSCIRYHDRPKQADAHHDLVAAVHLARVLARACGHVAGADRFIWGIDDSALSRLGLRLDDYQPILARFLDEWQIVDMYEVGAR